MLSKKKKIMAKIEEIIPDKEYYEKLFTGWNADQCIINSTKAVYELKDPDNSSARVCMYRDGGTMCLYGDYGSFMFDKMTWIATPLNLPYDNVSYLTEKLSKESRTGSTRYIMQQAVNDIAEWAKDCLMERFDADDEQIKYVMDYIQGTSRYSSVDSFIKSTPVRTLGNIENFMLLIDNLTEAAVNSEAGYISCVESLSYDIDKYDSDPSELYQAGHILDPRLFISLYAMQICAEKLKKEP